MVIWKRWFETVPWRATLATPFALCPKILGTRFTNYGLWMFCGELMVIWKRWFETVPCRVTLNNPFSALCPRILGTRFTNYGLRVSGIKKKHVKIFFTGLSRHLGGFLLMCFLLPHKEWPKKTHKQIFGTPPSPGTIPQICWCLCGFLPWSIGFYSATITHCIAKNTSSEVEVSRGFAKGWPRENGTICPFGPFPQSKSNSLPNLRPIPGLWLPKHYILKGTWPILERQMLQNWGKSAKRTNGSIFMHVHSSRDLLWKQFR